jgi:hypothetical protein
MHLENRSVTFFLLMSEDYTLNTYSFAPIAATRYYLAYYQNLNHFFFLSVLA